MITNVLPPFSQFTVCMLYIYIFTLCDPFCFTSNLCEKNDGLYHRLLKYTLKLNIQT